MVSTESGRLLAKHPVVVRGPWAGLIIEDMFSISAELASLDGPSVSEEILSLAKAAKDAYATEGVAGSDRKDVRKKSRSTARLTLPLRPWPQA